MMQLDTQLYTDSDGRMFRVLVPEGGDPKYGVIVGPPLLDNLNLPTVTMIKLHNELYHRGLFTYDDVKNRRSEVMSALQSALKLTIEGIVEAYV